MRRVLVFQLARFGDLIQSKRLLLSLHAEGNTRVHLCVDSTLAALARCIYPFAEVHSLPAHMSGASALPAEVLQSARALFRELGALDFAAVYCLNFSPLSFACAALFPPEKLRGYALVRGQERVGDLFSLSFNLMRDRRFAPLNLADLWAHLHPAPVPPESVNPIPRPAGTGRIGIVMAGRESRRTLPPAALAACVQAVFQARGGPELICIGSKAENSLVRRLMRELPDQTVRKITDYTGRTGLTELPELIAGLDMVITPDTGAMHLAAHLGVPVQAFFLSSAWCFETGPYGFGHKIWQALEPCSPCLESAPCPHDCKCLSAFSHPSFLAHLAGKHEGAWPANLLGLVSMLDDTGVTCRVVDGEDPYAEGRRELRGGLAEYLKAYRPYAKDARPPFMSLELAEFLYAERNWMLPPDWRQDARIAPDRAR